MQFLDPTDPIKVKMLELNRLRDLEGKRLAYLSNGWESMNKIGRHIAEPLRREYGIAEITPFDIPRNREPSDGLLERIAQQFDVAIVGMAN